MPLVCLDWENRVLSGDIFNDLMTAAKMTKGTYFDKPMFLDVVLQLPMHLLGQPLFERDISPPLVYVHAGQA